MAYTINLTDGAIFATIPDGTIDTSSSMVLVGKNYAGYGEFLDENFIHLLENGANNTPPSAPLIGQLWWDKSTETMKAYNGTAFKVISGATASTSAPTSNVPGDLWWDITNAQLKVWNGASFTLIGPASSGPGVSGAIVTTITDNVAVPHVVVQLFVDNTIVGMVSKDATFTPQTPIPGFAQIAPGIQLSTSVPNALFRGTALNANTLETLAASAFMRTNINTSTQGTLAVLNDGGLTVGLDQDARISVNIATSEVIVDNQTQDANLSMRVTRPGNIATTVMRALGSTGEVTFPAAAGVSVTGNITAPQIVKSGANNSGNIGSATNVFNTVFANTFQGTVATANNVSGTVAVANGGTGRNTLNTDAVILGNGTANVNFVAPGAANNVLTSNGTTWISAPPTGGGGGNVVSVTAAAGSPIQVTGTTSNPVVGITSPIPVANGGTGGSSFTSNNVLLGNGTNAFQTVAPGTDGNVLLSQSGNWVSSGTVVRTSGDQSIAGNKTFTGNVAAGVFSASNQLQSSYSFNNDSSHFLQTTPEIAVTTRVSGDLRFFITANSAGFTFSDVQKVGGGTFNTYSDSRLKQDVVPYIKGLEAIQQLEPKSYRFTADYMKSQEPSETFVGLIAQEVQTTDLGSMISEGRDGYLKLDSNEMLYALVNAVKDLKKEIDDLRAQING